MTFPLSRPMAIVLWAILLGLLAAPFVYIFVWCPREEFFDNVMSGLLATAGGLIGGIPVALWIDRTVKQQEEKKKQIEERKRETELLDLIKEELSFTNSLLEQRKTNPNNLYVQPLKSDLWAAISAAGKLNLIGSHRLLNRIASAYYVINVVRKVEEQGYIASRSATVTFSNGKNATQILWEDARRFDTLLSDSIREALNDINTDLSKKA